MDRVISHRGNSKMYLVAYDKEEGRMGFLEVGTLNFTNGGRQIIYNMYITTVEKWDYERKIELIEDYLEDGDSDYVLDLLKKHNCVFSELAQNEIIKWNSEDRFGEHLYKALHKLMDREGNDYQADVCSIGKADLSYYFPDGVIPEFAPLVDMITVRCNDLTNEEVDLVISQLDSVQEKYDMDGIFKEICEEYYGVEGLY